MDVIEQSAWSLLGSYLRSEKAFSIKLFPNTWWCGRLEIGSSFFNSNLSRLFFCGSSWIAVVLKSDKRDEFNIFNQFRCIDRQRFDLLRLDSTSDVWGEVVRQIHHRSACVAVVLENGADLQVMTGSWTWDLVIPVRPGSLYDCCLCFLLLKYPWTYFKHMAQWFCASVHPSIYATHLSWRGLHPYWIKESPTGEHMSILIND